MSKTIELKEEMLVPERPGKHFKKTKIFVALLKVISLIVLCVVVSIHVASWYGKAQTYVETQYTLLKHEAIQKLRGQNLIEETSRKQSLISLINAYSEKYGLNPAIGMAIVQTESGGDPNRIRFEQSWKDAYSNQIPKDNMNDIEYNLNFASIGLMQIGVCVHKDFCGINSFVELFDPERNLDCGLKIMSKCLKENEKITPKGRRLRYCFARYNGSGKKAEEYADKMMSRLADAMLDDGLDPKSIFGIEKKFDQVTFFRTKNSRKNS